MTDLSKLLALKSKAKDPDIRSIDADQSTQGQAYLDLGYKDALDSNGSPKMLSQSLEDNYEKFTEQCRKDETEQERLNDPHRQKKAKLHAEYKQKEVRKTIIEGEREEQKKSIAQIDSDIAEVKTDPERFGLDTKHRAKAQFYIGLVILLPVTIYLLVFYMSASYSAFFKNFESGGVMEAIFDANALVSALNDGWLEAVFICTIPFAFMGLGYLLHMFQKTKKRGFLKIAGLVIVTFVFDVILAYQIDMKLYNLTRTLNSPEFGFQDAITSVRFWGIIFAGFVVYIIWGLVFDFVMKEYEDIDKIRAFIKNRLEEKANLQKMKGKISEEVNQLEEETASLKAKMEEIDAHINCFKFDVKKYLLYHREYCKGYFKAIESEIRLSNDIKSELIEQCEKTSIQHLERHGVEGGNTDDTIYLTPHLSTA
jgi:hypothetical protein